MKCYTCLLSMWKNWFLSMWNNIHSLLLLCSYVIWTLVVNVSYDIWKCNSPFKEIYCSRNQLQRLVKNILIYKQSYMPNIKKCSNNKYIEHVTILNFSSVEIKVINEYCKMMIEQTQLKCFSCTYINNYTYSTQYMILNANFATTLLLIEWH